MIGLLNYLSRQPVPMPGMQQQMGLLGAMSNQGKLLPPQQMMPMDPASSNALQGAQQNAIVMPAKKKDDGVGLMGLFKLFMGG